MITRVEVSGITVLLTITDTADGPLLCIGCEGHDMEGISPGEYLLIAAESSASMGDLAC